MSKVPVYDSEYRFPTTWNGQLSPEEFSSLQVPSSRFYYMGKSMIPVPSVVLDKQGRIDLEAWLNPTDIPVIYAQKVISAYDPEADLIEILKGFRVIGYDLAYLRELRSVLISQGFPTVDPNTVELLAKYPPNPATDIFRAMEISLSRNPDSVREYLNELGVIHLNPDTLINLEISDLFFYLSRFYPPPPSRFLSIQHYVIVKAYQPYAKNNESRLVLSKLRNNFDLYQQHKSTFDAYFIHINDNPDNPLVWMGIGGTDKDRFYRDFFQYLKLIDRPSRVTLPPLTLNTLKQLVNPTVRGVASFLVQYFDNEIISLVGRDINNAQTRRDLATAAAEILLHNQYLLLLPMEASLCKNKETIYQSNEFRELTYPFIGRGNFLNGLDCYDITDIFRAFENNRKPDGSYSFTDPTDYSREMSIVDLQGIQDAFRRGRPGVASSSGLESILGELDRYITQMTLQQSKSYTRIMTLRNWAKESTENTVLMSEIWNTYFRMAMYMRQWKGPGTPYPFLESETGSEAIGGTIKEESISHSVQEEGSHLNELLIKTPDQIQDNFWELLIYRVSEGQFMEDSRRTIRTEYHNVIELGNSCIRVASSPWAYTAIFYLKQTVNQGIAGVPLSISIELIQ